MDAGAAFWIFLAAVIVAGIITGNWRKKHIESVRHETMRLIIEKNTNLEAEQLAEMLNPSHPELPKGHPWLSKPDPGADNRIAYGMFRVFGTIMIFVAIGLSVAGIWRCIVLGVQDESVVGIVTAVPIVALVGAGLFFCSRYVKPPPVTENENKQDL